MYVRAPLMEQLLSLRCVIYEATAITTTTTTLLFLQMTQLRQTRNTYGRPTVYVTSPPVAIDHIHIGWEPVLVAGGLPTNL